MPRAPWRRTCEERRTRPSTSDAHLFAEIVHRQAESLLEVDLRLPAKVVARPGVVEGDAEDVAFSPRAKVGLEPVLGQKSELPEQLVDRPGDAAPNGIGAPRAGIRRGEVGDRSAPAIHHA